MFITRGLSLTVQLCSAPSEKLFLPKPCDTDEAWSPAQPMSATAACTCQHKSLISQRRPSDGTALAGPCCKKGPTYLLNGGRGQAPRSSEITRIFTSWNNPGFVFLLSLSKQHSVLSTPCPQQPLVAASWAMHSCTGSQASRQFQARPPCSPSSIYFLFLAGRG